MRLALAQMSMSDDMTENFEKSIKYIEKAAENSADIICFPEVQLTKFFPQYDLKSNQDYHVRYHQDMEKGAQVNDTRESVFRLEEIQESALTYDSELFHQFLEEARKNKIWVAPNFYFKDHGKYYDMSFLISDEGKIVGIQKMVHIAQAEKFYEQDYYTPSEEGFDVFDTPFGKMGIVVCFDRHIPESIRTERIKGAKLIIIPTANTKEEDMELFECEMRTQSYHNGVIIAMCNRVGTEDKMNFAGESIVTVPDGSVLYKLGDKAGLGIIDIDEKWFGEEYAGDRHMKLRREECYQY